MAEKKSASEKKPDSTPRRKKQLTEITQAEEALHAELNRLREDSRKLQFQKSVASGLYIEIDKLTKKAPAEEVTELVLKHVNDLIRQAKDLLKSDEYMKGLTEFIPAGNNPQYRDVIIVLRQIRHAFDRLTISLGPRLDKVKDLITQAETVRVALGFYIQGETTPDKDDIEFNIPSASERWLDVRHPYKFRFDILDQTNITEYFIIEDQDEPSTDVEGDNQEGAKEDAD
jgi:hypothetical protein